MAGYDYLYKGLQVGAIEPTVGSVPVIRTVNAGSGRTYGVELVTAYRPADVEGLGLNAAVNWNHTRFNSLDGVPCYGGQTVAAAATSSSTHRPASISYRISPARASSARRAGR